MKGFDKDTATLWYCFAMFGVLVSLALDKFASIPMRQSLWYLVPGFLAAGWLALRWWNRALERRHRAESTPAAIREIPGLGIAQLRAGRWETDSSFRLDDGRALPVLLALEAGESGPSARQVELAGRLSSDAPALWREWVAALERHFEAAGAGEGLETVALDRCAVEIHADGAPADMGVTFETEGEHSDMAYTLVLKDWRVIEVQVGD